MTKQSSCCHEAEQKPTCHETEHSSACHEPTSFDKLLWGSLIGVVILWLLALIGPDSISHYPWLETMAHTVHEMVHAMWWGVVIGIIFVGLLAKVPREFMMAVLGQGGTVSGLFRATGAGVLLDLCSHGILMVAAKLYERGASAGQVIAFLLASPWNSFSLTLVLVGLIGIKWTALFIVLSMVIALVTGWIFDVCVARGVLPKNPNTPDKHAEFSFWENAKNGIQSTSFNLTFFTDILRTGLKDGRMVIRWLIFGILLAALLRAVLDPSQFESYFGPTVLGLVVTVFIATVLEVCSEGSTPIAADIVNRANAPGNGFAFLMSGVSTDYTELMVLKDTSKSWRFALFLPLISLPQIITIAAIINHVA